MCFSQTVWIQCYNPYPAMILLVLILSAAVSGVATQIPHLVLLELTHWTGVHLLGQWFG